MYTKYSRAPQTPGSKTVVVAVDKWGQQWSSQTAAEPPTNLSNNPAGFMVYDLRTQNLRFVAPMPEQIGTTTVHFREASGGTYQKFSSPKLGEPGQIDVFEYRM